jgi:deazaflavin-dependent oxidoreductase (nitroreductase family)
MPVDFHLTTTGRKTELPREIEIWFVEREGRFYMLTEEGFKAHWVRNIPANPAVTIRVAGQVGPALAECLIQTKMVNFITRSGILRERSTDGETGSR